MMRNLMDRLAGALSERVAARLRDDARWSPATKVALRHLWLAQRSRALRNEAPPDLMDAGFRIFSQFEEDGIVVCLLASFGNGSRRFVDIGAGDGVYASNCANLAINFGFHGLLVDAEPGRVDRGRRFYAEHPDTALYPPTFVHARVTPATVNDLVRNAGFEGDIDLLSIDIDGNDYWIWEALTVVSPRVVLIEARPELGRRPRVAACADDTVPDPTRHPEATGASPAALVALGKRRGYRLVAANRYGFNLFFLRDDLDASFPTLSLDALFVHPRVAARLIPDAVVDTLRLVEPPDPGER